MTNKYMHDTKEWDEADWHGLIKVLSAAGLLMGAWYWYTYACYFYFSYYCYDYYYYYNSGYCCWNCICDN